jgi:hypothetical protein
MHVERDNTTHVNEKLEQWNSNPKKGVTKATQTQQKKCGNGNENRSQQNGEYLQLRLAVGICFLRSCVLKSVSIQNIQTKQKGAYGFFRIIFV